MKASQSLRPFLAPLFVLLVFALGIPANAVAATSPELVDKVPAVSPLLVGVDLPKVRDTKLFGEATTFLTKVAPKESLVAFALSNKAFDYATDIDSALVAFQTAPTSPTAAAPPLMAVVSGRFDVARVKSAVTNQYGALKSRKDGAMEIFTAGDVDFAFPNANTLVISDSKFAAAAWDAVKQPATKSAKSNRQIGELLSMTDTSKGFWFAVNAKAVPTPAGAPTTDSASIAVDLSSGLAFEAKTKFAKAEDATKALAQFEELKKNQDEALINMLGLKPVLEKSVATIQDKHTLTMASSMSEWEVKVMLERIRSMNEAPAPIAPSKAGTTQQPTTPKTPGEGANADFN